MKLKKLLPILLLTLPTLGSCNSKPLDIEFNKIIDMAYVDEEYDFATALEVQSGINYSLEVFYQDYYEMKEYSLEVKDTFKFTPVTTFDLNVYVTASKGSQTVTRMKTIFVTYRADPIDDLVKTGSFSGYADQGISKHLTTDEKYLYSENSRTALDVRYQGGLPYTWGCNVFTLNNFRLLDYWTDKTWDNAVLRFYVFNPTDYDFEFQLRLVDNWTNSLDCDWGFAINTPQFAKAGEWTEILFSLKHYGITFPLFINEDATRTDEFNVKAKWLGAPEDGSFYSYQLFVDGIDVVPYTKEEFPNLDTAFKNSRETIDFGWENLPRDEGWSKANVCFDDGVVYSTGTIVSLSSMHLEFNDVKGDTSENGYFVAFDLKNQFGEENLPSFRHGTLDFDIYFTNVENKTIKLITVMEDEKGDWADIARVDFLPLETNDGWYHLSIDFGKYEQYELHTKEVRLGFSFPGIDGSNKNDAHIYLDNIYFDQEGGLPERPIPIKEDLSSGLENGLFDGGWNGCIYSITNEEFNNTASTPSSASLKLTFNSGRKFDGFYGVVLDIENDYQNQKIAFSNVILSFDMKFVGFEDETICIKAVGNPSDWSQGGKSDSFSGSKSSSGWTHFEIDTSTVECFANVDHLVRLCFVLNGVNDGNCLSLTAYLDNVIINNK